MRKKKVIGFLLLGILVVIGAIIVGLLNKSVEITEKVESVESIEDTESIESEERTDEEYISILLDNQEDFDYVAEMMQQWPARSSIHLKEGISSKDHDISDEIENNVELYDHLKNLYVLNEIDFILVEGEEIVFYFMNPPKDYIGSFLYWENTEECDFTRAKIIDEHWTLEILPAI